MVSNEPRPQMTAETVLVYAFISLLVMSQYIKLCLCAVFSETKAL